MSYKIVRLDGIKDKITSKSYEKYSDAYDTLEKIYGDLCCSDTDYNNITYYNIVENIPVK